jgi:two-component system nitrate/nitrite response regulator NarL
MTSPVRVLIADDHPLFRLGLKFALQAQGFEVVAEAETGSQAVHHCRSCPIDVAILDVRMPDGDGIAACQQITELGLPVVVVMMTTFQEPGLIEAARRAGAKGYLSKETDPAELARVIRQIVAATPSKTGCPPDKSCPSSPPASCVCCN